MLVNSGAQTIQAKVVYFGPAMSGKTTSLKALFKQFGKLDSVQSVETTTGRTLFLDFGKLEGISEGWKVTILLYTATGQEFYASTRPATLQGVDGIIFVFDSQRPLLDYNVRSWRELRTYFQEEFSTIPIVICLNKRDLDDSLGEEDVREWLRLDKCEKVRVFETVATRGQGVYDSFEKMLHFLELAA